MKLYLISQSVNTGYDTYNCAVVAAKNEEDARKVLPSEHASNYNYATWAPPEHVSVEYLGTAKPGTKAGSVICADFLAG